MRKKIFFSLSVCLFYIQATGRCCAVTIKSPYPAENWEPFPICCMTSMCMFDVSRDPLRMDKWQKMRFLPSPPLFPLPCFRGQYWGGGSGEGESVCLSVWLEPTQTLHICPSELWAPQGESASEAAFLPQQWQAKGGHSATQPRGNRAVEKPPDLSVTHSVRKPPVSGPRHHRKGLVLKG